MKFMSLVRGDENAGPAPQALFDAIDKLFQESTKQGKVVSMGGLHPTAKGTRVRITKGKLTVTDGPFTEAKEVVGGFAVFNYDSKEEAVRETVRFMELHRKHWPGWDGECEVRQMFEENEGPETAK